MYVYIYTYIYMYVYSLKTCKCWCRICDTKRHKYFIYLYFSALYSDTLFTVALLMRFSMGCLVHTQTS